MPFGPSQLLQLSSRLLDGLYYPIANKSQLMTSQLASLRLERTCGNEMPSLKPLITQLPRYGLVAILRKLTVEGPISRH